MKTNNRIVGRRNRIIQILACLYFMVILKIPVIGSPMTGESD
ncbi:MAG: hypothetical protein ACQ5SW_01275 [Sphaerochaetaceae bacterium]